MTDSQSFSKSPDDPVASDSNSHKEVHPGALAVAQLIYDIYMEQQQCKDEANKATPVGA